MSMLMAKSGQAVQMAMFPAVNYMPAAHPHFAAAPVPLCVSKHMT